MPLMGLMQLWGGTRVKITDKLFDFFFANLLQTTWSTQFLMRIPKLTIFFSSELWFGSYELIHFHCVLHGVLVAFACINQFCMHTTPSWVSSDFFIHCCCSTAFHHQVLIHFNVLFLLLGMDQPTPGPPTITLLHWCLCLPHPSLNPCQHAAIFSSL